MRALLVVLGGGLLACSDPIESVSLEFRADSVGVEKVREWSVAQVETGYHRVSVRRVAEAVGSCERLHADLLRTGRVLTLRIRDAGGSGAEAGVVSCGYTAVIDRVPSGRYTLRVVHSGPASRSGARVVLDQPLHIR